MDEQPNTPTSDRIQAMLQYPLPHHFLSRIVFALTRIRTPWKDPIVRWFINQYGVNLAEAKHQDLKHYPSFNDFFTRELHEGARPICQQAESIVSPVDGKISQIGDIKQGQIFQAKGINYPMRALLGGEESDVAPFENGRFANVYLSPKDYHRIHMPVAGTLRKMIHIPGRLFSVAPHIVENVPNLFARNERVVAFFDTPAGPMAMVLVGAINVAAIETVWSGLVTPPQSKVPQTWHYGDEVQVNLDKGAEMGRFNMGSTVILLMGENCQWDEELATTHKLKMGESIGQFTTAEAEA